MSSKRLYNDKENLSSIWRTKTRICFLATSTAIFYLWSVFETIFRALSAEIISVPFATIGEETEGRSRREFRVWSPETGWKKKVERSTNAFARVSNNVGRGGECNESDELWHTSLRVMFQHFRFNVLDIYFWREVPVDLNFELVPLRHGYVVGRLLQVGWDGENTVCFRYTVFCRDGIKLPLLQDSENHWIIGKSVPL